MGRGGGVNRTTQGSGEKTDSGIIYILTALGAGKVLWGSAMKAHKYNPAKSRGLRIRGGKGQTGGATSALDPRAGGSRIS